MESELKSDPRFNYSAEAGGPVHGEEVGRSRWQKAENRRGGHVSGEGAASSAAATAGASSSSSGGPQKMHRDDVQQDGGGDEGIQKKMGGRQEHLAARFEENRKVRIGAIVNQDEDGPRM